MKAIYGRHISFQIKVAGDISPSYDVCDDARFFFNRFRLRAKPAMYPIPAAASPTVSLRAGVLIIRCCAKTPSNCKNAALPKQLSATANAALPKQLSARAAQINHYTVIIFNIVIIIEK